jgi:hypothetical protein
MSYELHPLCTLFPRLSGAEFDALRDDIKANGLRTPIVLHDGMILDGGNRYRACLEAGVEPAFLEFEGGNLWSFVWSMNGNRRHLSPGQQAAIVASGQDWAKAQSHGGIRRGDQAATLPLETVQQRAAESGASERTQRMADKVAKADPALAVKVAHGEVSLPKAHAAVSKPAKADSQPPEDDGPSAEEIAEARKAAEDDAETMRLLLESDDKLAAMTEKCKQQAALIRTLESRIAGLTNEAAQAVRLAKSWRIKYEKLEKASA